MPNTHLERAQQYYASGQLHEAIASYELALHDDPNSVDILHALGVIKAQLNQLDDAMLFINKALKKNPDNARILNSKANILVRQHRWDDAIKSYRRAVAIDPNYAVAYTGLGNCLYQQNDLSAAENALKKAIELNPQFIEAQYNYALVLTKKECWPEAIALLEPIVAKHANFSAALGQLGELYLQTNQPLRALTVLDRRAELEPENPQALHSLAQALALTDHLEESIQYYENTLMRDPHHLEANQNLANAYVKLGDTNKALNYYFRQLSIQPLPESYFNIGVLMMYQERNKEAIEYFDQAAILDPTNTAVLLNLGSIYLKQQHYGKALETYQRVLTQEPQNDEIQYIVDALNNDATPARAPNDYLRNLFNHYADHYDQHLTQYLHYTVPQQLTQLLMNELGYTPKEWRIVDLGCGTGLSGQAFKPFARELIGIDISEQMIEVARKKTCYDTLIVGDIEQELPHYQNVDLIVAADVFSYIGDLSAVYKACHAALIPQGIVLFSVERATTGNFSLQKNMRYAHSKAYIESLAKEYHFDVLRCDNTILRKQQKQPVEGFLVMLKSNS